MAAEAALTRKSEMKITEDSLTSAAELNRTVNKNKSDPIKEDFRLFTAVGVRDLQIVRYEPKVLSILIRIKKVVIFGQTT